MFTNANAPTAKLEELLRASEKIVNEKLELKDTTCNWSVISKQLQSVGETIRTGQIPTSELKETINFGVMLAKASLGSNPELSPLFALYNGFQALGQSEKLSANNIRDFLRLL